MKSGIVKRSVVVDGHKTSVSLEDQFHHNGTTAKSNCADGAIKRLSNPAR